MKPSILEGFPGKTRYLLLRDLIEVAQKSKRYFQQQKMIVIATVHITKQKQREINISKRETNINKLRETMQRTLDVRRQNRLSLVI